LREVPEEKRYRALYELHLMELAALCRSEEGLARDDPLLKELSRLEWPDDAIELYQTACILSGAEPRRVWLGRLAIEDTK